jgi:hypothetical protein
MDKLHKHHPFPHSNNSPEAKSAIYKRRPTQGPEKQVMGEGRSQKTDATVVETERASEKEREKRERIA